ncbi:hypothetical protein BGZ80_011321 [Entomortierella chlamydospora]|uniref:Uncharacterized protein n=1 Tax=Entomortierella chlamydospora TaxID=101097 RepID=A0A9P6N718_9FUNG|nr:hypothetical protein BGZ80_011321 [Entomortierella chlamydospora]
MDGQMPHSTSEEETPMSPSVAIASTTSPLAMTIPGPHLDTTTVTTPSWLLWQFLDSALPTGGFIASNGLEAFAKLHPDQTSPRDVEAYVNWSVHSCGYTNLPFITAVWKLVDDWTLKDSQLKTEKGKAKAMNSVLHRIGNLDREYDVFVNNAIQNAASRKQGDGIIMMGVKCFAEQLNYKKNGSKNANGGSSMYEGQDDEDDDYGDDNELEPNIRILKPFKAMLRSEDIAATTRYLHLHLHARTLLSSAIRLALVGPFQAQHIMTRSQAKARFIDAKTADLTIEDAAQTFLVGDICGEMGIQKLFEEIKSNGSIATDLKDHDKQIHLDFMATYFRLVQTKCFDVLNKLSRHQTLVPHDDNGDRSTAQIGETNKRNITDDHGPPNPAPSNRLELRYSPIDSLDQMIQDALNDLAPTELFLINGRLSTDPPEENPMVGTLWVLLRKLEY